MTFVHAALKAGNTAVITGAAAGGIGFSISRLLLQRYGMKVLLADISTDSLQSASTALIAAGVPEESFFTHVCDVSDEDAVFELADLAFSKLGRVDFLALNAGAGGPTKSYGSREEMQKWKKIMNVNLGGVQNGTAAFVQRMVDQGTPGAVVVTGSKQGMTLPPGSGPAYNVSKAAINALAQALAHDLLPTSVTAHLLVPGYTYTKMTSQGATIADANNEKKPAAAWSADQVAEDLFARLDEFFIICPDNDVNWALDSARIAWNVDDVLQKRPALSRWHPEFESKFAEYVKEKTGK